MKRAKYTKAMLEAAPAAFYSCADRGCSLQRTHAACMLFWSDRAAEPGWYCGECLGDLWKAGARSLQDFQDDWQEVVSQLGRVAAVEILPGHAESQDSRPSTG